MPKSQAPSYQEAVVRSLPLSPFLSWPIICLVILGAVAAVLRNQFFSIIQSEDVNRVLLFLALSYSVIVFEILGIIFGQRLSDGLKPLLPQLLGPNYHEAPTTWDQRCLSAWNATLSWEERLRRIWRCGPILVVATAGGIFGFTMGYT